MLVTFHLDFLALILHLTVAYVNTWISSLLAMLMFGFIYDIEQS